MTNQNLNTTLIAEPVMMFKVYDGEVPKYSLSLTSGASTTLSGMGTMLYLQDNSEFQWKDKRVKVMFASDHPFWQQEMFAYVYIDLTDQEVKRLAKSSIRNYRLFVHDYTLPKKIARTFKQQVGCLLKSKSRSDTTQRR